MVEGKWRSVNSGHSPHEADKQHDHDEVGWILGSGLVLVQAAWHKHLQEADDGGGQHLDSTYVCPTHTKTKQTD